MTAPALVIAAPASGSGKTLITLSLLRALADRGVDVVPAKVGPDYIDPRFHEAASGRASVNLDGWAMRATTLDRLASIQAGLLLVEGVMGLFDGAAASGAVTDGSTADLAARFGWPVVLVVDCARQAQSVAALVHGFRSLRAGVTVAGVILNRVAGARHESMLRDALAPLPVTVLGAVPRDDALTVPSRHLGLVPAEETPALEALIAGGARLAAERIDLDALARLAAPGAVPTGSDAPAAPFPPPGQRVAVARDVAFAFAYPHLLDGWRAAGAGIVPFSPLADEPPPGDADAVFLPGGYPELHAGRLAAATRFLGGLRAAAGRGAAVYGECGGYMVLGDGLVDADGARHRMAGLLPLETSFADRRLHLGYRAVVTVADGPLGAAGTGFRGHEFHYATIVDEGAADPLFAAADATGTDRGPAGRARGRVAGSFVHLVDRA